MAFSAGSHPATELELRRSLGDLLCDVAEPHTSVSVRRTVQWSSESSSSDVDTASPSSSRTETEGRPGDATKLEAFLGIDEGPCALPGDHHDGGALVGRWREGSLQYACNCLGWMPGQLCPECCHERRYCQCHWRNFQPFYYRPLGDAYYAIKTGVEVGFNDRLPSVGLRAMWWLLLEHAAGLRPVAMPRLDLAADASKLERRAAEFFGLKHGLEASEGYGAEGIRFPVRLVADWLGVDKDRAHEAIKALRDHGTIRVVGKSRRAFLYVPGTVR
jgi:hypothetical protein